MRCSGKCYILIIIPLLLSALWFSSGIVLFSCKIFATCLWIKILARRVLLFVNDSRRQQDIVFPGGLLIYFLFSSLTLFICGDKCQLWTGDLWDRKDKAQFTNHFLRKQTGAMTEPACCNWISCCYLLSHKKMSTSRMLAVEKVLIHYDFECRDDNIVWVLTLDSK